MTFTAVAIAQVLLTCHPEEPGPLRFGFPLPERQLSRGLRITGPAGTRLQWRRLQRRPDPATGRVWVELCIDRPAAATRSHAMRILAGGRGPTRERNGPVVRHETVVRPVASTAEDGMAGGDVSDAASNADYIEQIEQIDRWCWGSGTVDVVRSYTFHTRQEFAGQMFAAGESITLGSDPARFARTGIRARAWRQAGVLPRGGDVGRDYRRRLVRLVSRMAELEGVRDRGDYKRSREVITNLEFDTTFAFASLGLAEARPELLARAQRSALHSIDIDLDPRTNLLHRHGADHRQGPPEPGHTWLQGVLLVGCLTADDRLLHGAQRIARGLARRTRGASRWREAGAPSGTRKEDRVRDAGWPLLEMEAWLRFADDREVEAAVAALVADMRQRWDPRNKVFRFGEGVRSKGVFEAPLWVTAGSLVPGLRAYVQRTGDKAIGKILRIWEARLAAVIRDGRPGLPVRAWIASGAVISQARVAATPRGFMLLEGVSARDLPRVLARRAVRDALAEVPAWDDPDVATSFSIVGRCRWIYR